MNYDFQKPRVFHISRNVTSISEIGPKKTQKAERKCTNAGPGSDGILNLYANEIYSLLSGMCFGILGNQLFKCPFA